MNFNCWVCNHENSLTEEDKTYFEKDDEKFIRFIQQCHSCLAINRIIFKLQNITFADEDYWEDEGTTEDED